MFDQAQEVFHVVQPKTSYKSLVHNLVTAKSAVALKAAKAGQSVNDTINV